MPEIPLSTTPLNLPTSLTFGTIRHVLTTVGGYWIAVGMTTVNPSALLWGAGMVTLGLAWSWVDKVVKRIKDARNT